MSVAHYTKLYLVVWTKPQSKHASKIDIQVEYEVDTYPSVNELTTSKVAYFKFI